MGQTWDGPVERIRTMPYARQLNSIPPRTLTAFDPADILNTTPYAVVHLVEAGRLAGEDDAEGRLAVDAVAVHEYTLALLRVAD
jgi:hypothetical protein